LLMPHGKKIKCHAARPRSNCCSVTRAAQSLQLFIPNAAAMTRCAPFAPKICDSCPGHHRNGRLCLECRPPRFARRGFGRKTGRKRSRPKGRFASAGYAMVTPPDQAKKFVVGNSEASTDPSRSAVTRLVTQRRWGVGYPAQLFVIRAPAWFPTTT